ncbi:MAG: efflux transporter outer membrane subunit [Variovorax sp.]|nr:MAG: efflux transporter outer membrane subunit [Variovorax sp.]
MNRMRRPALSSRTPGLALATIAVAVLGGCALTEPRTPLPTVLPAAWNEAQAVGTNQRPAAPIAADWWRGFSSPQLESLVAEAMQGSTDLRLAAQRVQQADIALRLAGVSQLPSVNGSVGSSAARSNSSGTPTSTRESTSVSLSVSYELDLWGRLAAGAQGAQASLAASRYDLETARITLAASVATTYFQLLATRERVLIARDNLATAERVLRIVEARRRFGVATPLDVSQQTTAVLQLRTALIPLETQVRQTASALALLLGRVPQGFDAGAGETLRGLRQPAVSAWLPSDLLSRRPDLASAEAQLAAADADVAAARAALLPSISLSAGAGTSSAALLSLVDSTRSVSLGLSLAQSLFDNGRQRLAVESTRLQREALVENYAAAARRALKEVDDALGNADRNARQEIAQEQVVAQAQRALGLAELRYREGADTLLTVLDAQRTLFSAQDSLLQLRLQGLSGAVDLYRVLGGGWQAAQAR